MELSKIHLCLTTYRLGQKLYICVMGIFNKIDDDDDDAIVPVYLSIHSKAETHFPRTYLPTPY